MAKYSRRLQVDVVDRNGIHPNNGCATFSVINAGNTDCTILTNVLLKPDEEFEGPNEHPEVADYTLVDISFGSEITRVPAPGPGTPLDQRILIVKTFIS